MYEMAKKAREAMRGKAKRLAGEKDQKTDSSDWTPAEPLNADAKTGMRPVSPRQFKKGGKVEGKASVKHAGRKGRKAGGRLLADNDKKEAKDIAIAKMNRNQKEANAERPGVKHIGGLKTGGRAKKQVGGGMGVPMPPELPEDVKAARALSRQLSNPEGMDVNAAQAQRMNEAMQDNARQQQMQNAFEDERRRAMMGRKRGGRAKKAFGGLPMPQDVGKTVIQGLLSGKGQVARKKGGKVNYEPSCDLPEEKAVTSTKGQEAIEKSAAKRSMPKRGKAQHYADGGNTPDPRMGVVNKQFLNFGTGASGSPYKKGGAAEKHDDEKMDKALIKKMVKPSARTGKNNGGGNLISPEESHGIRADVAGTFRQAKREAGGDDVYGSDEKFNQYMKNVDRIDAFKKEHGQTDLKRGGKAKRPGKFYGGAMGPGTAPQMIPPAQQTGMPPLPQLGRKSGGRTKGKTNINIVIAAGKPMPGMDKQMPPGGMPGLPGGPAGGGVPIPMGGGAPAPAAPPMPIPMPMPMPAGAPPMARKAGGRISKVAKSYKDMTAGAGSGEGRLQKTDIAKRGERKAGGKVYRSYKDMDAGAGSGVGRLEKTEIQKRK